MGIPEDVMQAINEMYLCRNLLEHMACYHKNKEILQECIFWVFSDNEGGTIPNYMLSQECENFSVINLGCADHYYVVDQEAYEEMLKKGKYDYAIDTCIDLDTQAVSYLRDMFRIDGNVNIRNDKLHMLEYLHQFQADYSCMPYAIENAIKMNKENEIQCYQNLKSFMWFKSFDYAEYIKSGEIKYNNSEENIVYDADYMYREIKSQKLVYEMKNLYEQQKAIYALLIKAACIEFENSKKSAKNKILMLIDFVNYELGVAPIREIEACLYFFRREEKAKKFFKKIKDSNKKILSDINGMAWDFTHIRHIEKEFMEKPTEKVKIAIHALLSYDHGLAEILQLNPVKQMVFYRNIPMCQYERCVWDELPECGIKLFDEDIKSNRYETFHNREISAVIKQLEEELKTFMKVEMENRI